MPHISPLIEPNPTKPIPCAVFLSGSGTNARRILEYQAAHPDAAFRVALLVTDRPESAAETIAAEFGLPAVLCDIRQVYEDHGLKRLTIATPEGRAAREAWTEQLRQALAAHDVAFGVFAGFIPLTNLCRELPCLNVHPGDLTVLVDGERHLVGLHTIPVERALLLGLDNLRSSVILVDPYDADPAAMDTGPILGISPRVPTGTGPADVARFEAITAARPAKRPRGGYTDALAELAGKLQDDLKEGGDWVVLPPVVNDVAAGCIGLDAERGLYFRDSLESPWQPVATVAYDRESREPIPR